MLHIYDNYSRNCRYKFLTILLFLITTQSNQYRLAWRRFGKFTRYFLLIFGFIYTVWNSQLSRESVNIVFSFWIISNIISLKHPFIAVIRFFLKQANHRMRVSFFADLKMSPFLLFSFINIEWFIWLAKRIIVIRQFVSIVILTSELLNTQVFCSFKGYDFGLIWPLANKSMMRPRYLSILKV